MKKISALYSYPVKSTRTQSHNTVKIDRYGIEGDRQWAVVDEYNKCMTSRDYPQFMHLDCINHDGNLTIQYKNQEVAKLEKQEFENGHKIDFNVHSYSAHGRTSIANPINEWLCDFTKTKCQLVLLDPDNPRPVLSKHGGSSGDLVGFSDQAPILIVSEASLAEVNSRLGEKIEMNRFRPNIVVSNCTPYEEDTWNEIKIGSVHMRIIQACERCVLITIDPITLVKHARAEPLTTLSKYRKGPRGGIIFGVHAVPISKGVININDPIEIIQ